MARPKKDRSELQTNKIVVYVTPETKAAFKSIVSDMSSSESKIGDLVIKQWVNSQKDGERMEYGKSLGGFDLTGSLNGGDLVYQKSVDVPFSCSLDDEKWDGSVSWIVPHGSHVEFYVQARGSGFKVIAGPSLSGWFLAFPVHEVCLDLASPDDLFYNEEKSLSCEHLNRIDGISAVRALSSLYKGGYIS